MCIKVKSFSVFIVALVSSCNVLADHAAVKLHGDKATYLFVETARQAIFTDKTVTLINVSKNTLWFTDRPERRFGHISTKSFIAAWLKQDSATSFKAVPPNAAFIESTNQPDRLEPIEHKVLELSHPQYDAKSDTLTYTISYLKHAQHYPRVIFNDVSLFIDEGISPLRYPPNLNFPTM